jgi:hypothetical protein
MFSVTMTLLALMVQGDAGRERVVYEKKLANGATVSYVQIRPKTREGPDAARDTWRYALRYSGAHRPTTNMLYALGPDDDLPEGETPVPDFDFVEVSGDEELLVTVYNEGTRCRLTAWQANEAGQWQLVAHSQDGSDIEVPPMEKAEITIRADGSVLVVLKDAKDVSQRYALIRKRPPPGPLRPSSSPATERSWEWVKSRIPNAGEERGDRKRDTTNTSQ